MKSLVGVMLFPLLVFAQEKAFPVTNDFGSSYTYACLIGESEIDCSGISEIGHVDGFKNIRMAVSGVANTCLVDDDGVWCVGFNSYGVNDVPVGLDHVSELSVSNYSGCAIQDSKLTCWGDDSSFNKVLEVPEDLKEPRLLTSNYGINCVVDGPSELHCWGYDFGGQAFKFPRKFKNIHSLAIGLYRICLSDDIDYTCWGLEMSNEPRPGYKAKFTALQMGNNFECGLSEEGLGCWGEAAWLPKFISRKDMPIDKISTGYNHLLARSGDKIYCWGGQCQYFSFR